MASPKLISYSTSSKNSDLRRRPVSSSSTKPSSILDPSNIQNHSIQIHNQRATSTSAISSISNDLGSMTVDGILRNACADNQFSGSTQLDAEIALLDAAGAMKAIRDRDTTPAILGQERASNAADSTVDDTWKEIVMRECKVEAEEEMNQLMTLDVFLAKVGVVEEEDVKAPITLFDSPVPPCQFMGTPPQSMSMDGAIGFGNGGRRGKRRALMEPLDKAAQRREMRMIKNRESAARSRERKQAYQAKLESLVQKLEEKNQQLLKEKAERSKGRFKQLMEMLVPVVEKQRPSRVLRRVRSMEWFVFSPDEVDHKCYEGQE